MMVALALTAGRAHADTNAPYPSSWHSVFFGAEDPSPVVAQSESRGQREPVDARACGCGWSREITYRSPDDIPVPDSVL
ncbi:MAG: hypothetical protein V2G44_08345 [bacterium JZ-2024 1]